MDEKTKTPSSVTGLDSLEGREAAIVKPPEAEPEVEPSYLTFSERLDSKLDSLRPRMWALQKQLERNERQRDRAIQHTRGLAEKEELFARYRLYHDEIQEELDDIVTADLVRQAQRLRLPVPEYPTGSGPDDDENENWRRGWVYGARLLTNAGIAKLRREIRQERKERREGAMTWIAALTGLVGALTGLAAVLLGK